MGHTEIEVVAKIVYAAISLSIHLPVSDAGCVVALRIVSIPIPCSPSVGGAFECSHSGFRVPNAFRIGLILGSGTLRGGVCIGVEVQRVVEWRLVNERKNSNHPASLGPIRPVITCGRIQRIGPRLMPHVAGEPVERVVVIVQR